MTSRHKSYIRWKSGQVQAIVANKAFGMGIDRADRALLLGIRSLRVCSHGLKNWEELEEMGPRHVLQYYIIGLTYHMHILGF